MENYIVRILRCEKDNPRQLVGVVETVGQEGKKAFTNLDELWGILNSTDLDAVRRRRKAFQKEKVSRKRCNNTGGACHEE